jgi:hypothetical protein
MVQHSLDKSPISLYFLDEEISEAFGELLQSIGFQTETLQSLQELASAQKIVTEPLFFDSLSSLQQESCLLVGNSATTEKFPCPVIRQPLTPEKVQRALQEFLGVQVAQ